ncbi:hypothetical protein ACJMK2_041980 [Sinanodonta woodiana]|uniref:Histone-binding protein RBBP4-like N-terminal domain-containing protein n=1 Tax=Sinanodonta woodiana TaxID=1069815 RepID=A0ABD3W5X5_SINWO
MANREGCYNDTDKMSFSANVNKILEVKERNNLLETYALKWPSLTTQWLPDITIPDGEDYSVHRLILGTHTSSDEQNYLMIASVQLPNKNPQVSAPHYDNQSVSSEMKIEMKIIHEGVVNKACFMPQNLSIIATKTSYSEVLIFDCTKHTYAPDPSGLCSPELILKCHHKEGYGLGSGDHTICLWDINSLPIERGVIDPITIFTEHTSVVNDVAWHPFYQSIYGSVADDANLLLWDIRSNNANPVVCEHDAEVHFLDFNPHKEFILATGSADETIALWDLRNLNCKLNEFGCYKVAPLQVRWSPHNENILAYSDIGKRLFVCDLSVLEREEQFADGAPTNDEFTYCKHTAEILELSWNPNKPGVISSVTEDSIVQIWQMSEHDSH